MNGFEAHMGGARHVALSATFQIPSNLERFWTFEPTGPGLVVRLPDARRLNLGWGQLTIVNVSGTFSISIQDASGATFGSLPTGVGTTFGLYNNSTAAGVWTAQAYASNVGAGTPPDYIAQIGGHANNGDTGDTAKWNDAQLYDIPTGVWTFFNAVFPTDMRNCAAARVGGVSYIKAASTGFYSFAVGSVLSLTPTGTSPSWDETEDYLGLEAHEGNLYIRALDSFSDTLREYDPIGDAWSVFLVTDLGISSGWSQFSVAASVPFNGNPISGEAIYWAVAGPDGAGRFLELIGAVQLDETRPTLFNWDRPSFFRINDNLLSMAAGSLKSSGDQESNVDTPMLTIHNQFNSATNSWSVQVQTPVAWKGFGAEQSTAPSLKDQAYTGLGSYYSTAVNGDPTNRVWRWSQITQTWDLSSQATYSGTYRQLNSWTTLDRI